MKQIFNEWLLQLAKKIVANRIVRTPTKMTREYLAARGFVEDELGDWYEPDIKERDRITITFAGECYRVWHGKARTFICMESSVEWFEMYFLLVHPDNGRYELAKV